MNGFGGHGKAEESDEVSKRKLQVCNMQLEELRSKEFPQRMQREQQTMAKT